jgi:hypothetical protein
MASTVLGTVATGEEGIASGVNNAIRELGGVFGIAILASVFSATGSYASGRAFTDGLVPAVVVGAGVVALAVIAALSIPRRRAASEVLDLDLEARADQPAAYALETAGAAGSISGL